MAADGAPLVLLGRPHCGLCDKLREVALPVLRELGLALVEQDVRDDPELERRYLFEVPVLLHRGEEVVRHRVTAADLRRRLLALGLGAPPPE